MWRYGAGGLSVLAIALGAIVPAKADGCDAVANLIVADVAGVKFVRRAGADTAPMIILKGPGDLEPALTCMGARTAVILDADGKISDADYFELFAKLGALATGVDATIIKKDAQVCYKATGGVSKDMPDTLEAHGLTFECGLSPDGRKLTSVGLRLD